MYCGNVKRYKRRRESNFFEQHILISKERNSAQENNYLYQECRIGKRRKSFVQNEMQVGKQNKELYNIGGGGGGSPAAINTLLYRAV